MNKFKQYFNPYVADTIPVLYFLYIVSAPLAWLLIKLRLTPSTITTISNIVAILALYIILVHDNFIIFFLLWVFALIFDICDGMVARVTKQQSAHGSFYDHFTDQIKILLLFLVAGLHYDTKLVWILTFLTATFFLLNAFLNYMLKFRRHLLLINIGEMKVDKPAIRKQSPIKRYFYNNIFLMQGNFMIYIALVFLQSEFFFPLLFVIVFNLLNGIRHMVKVNSQIMEKKLSWK